MKQIAAALVRAQKAFGPALKSSTNPHFRNKYADLSACVEAVIDALNENGVMLMQPTHECESGVLVETLFIHESGETLSAGKLHVPASKQDAQGYGSSLTYARRYSLMAACGIAPEDDDGEAARKSPPPQRQAQKPAVDLTADIQAYTIAIEDSVDMKNLVEVWNKANAWMKQNNVNADIKNALTDAKNQAKARLDAQKEAA